MKALLVWPRIPYPARDGGCVAMDALAQGLAEAGVEVHAFALNPAKNPGDPRAAAPGTGPLDLVWVDVDTNAVRPELLERHSPRAPLQVRRFFSAEAARRLGEVASRLAPDVVVLESPFLAPYLPFVRGACPAAVVLRSENVEADVWRRLAAIRPGVVGKALYPAMARALDRYERACLPSWDAILAITPADADWFRSAGFAGPVEVAPVGVRFEADAGAAGERPPVVTTLGAFGWRPNVEGLAWFVARVWPRILGRCPGAELRVGGGPAPAGAVAGAPGVKLLGRIPSADALVDGGRVFVSPVLSGGGMRVKALHALSRARPVVATPVGAAGLEALEGSGLLVASDPAELAGHVVRLLEDPSAATEAGRRGFEAARERFEVGAVGRAAAAFLERVRAGAASSGVPRAPRS